MARLNKQTKTTKNSDIKDSIQICNRVFILAVLSIFTTISVIHWYIQSLSAVRSTTTDSSVLFVGDVMLGRYVETLMNEHGLNYPFSRIEEEFKRHSKIIGNFEGSIPIEHVQTPNGILKFSVQDDSAQELSRVGFTVLTLANNHSLDYDISALLNTNRVFGHAGIRSSGHPNVLSQNDVIFFEQEGVIFSIIPINYTWEKIDLGSVTNAIDHARRLSDVIVITIHWGEEYEVVGNEVQKKFAHTLIDRGVDLIIGHHPHVVQHVEKYNGALIFYSLGNFIFDQYWENNVLEGLTVGMDVKGGSIKYSLLPVTSADRYSAPRSMTKIERSAFLHDLAVRSDVMIADEIRDGIIEMKL